MANTSNGKGYPPDPPNAHIKTDALPYDSPPVHRAKNDSNPTDIDQDLPNHSLPPNRSNQDQHQSNDDMEFYAADDNDDAPDATSDSDPVSYNDANDTADMIDNTDDNTDVNNGDSTDDDDDHDNDYIIDTDKPGSPTPTARLHYKTATDHDEITASHCGDKPESTSSTALLQYATTSEWDNSPWTQVSSRKKPAADADHNNPTTATATTNHKTDKNNNGTAIVQHPIANCTPKHDTATGTANDDDSLRDIPTDNTPTNIYITSYLYFRNRRLQPKLTGAPLY